MRIVFTALLLIPAEAAVAAAVVAAPVPEEEQLICETFENGSANWRTWATHTRFTREERRSMMELTVPGTNGNPTVSMRCADIGDDYYNCLLCFLRPSRPHEAGDRYRLSFRARAAEGTEFFAGIQFLSKQSAEDAGGVLAKKIVPFRGTGEWRSYSVPIDGPAREARSLEILFAPTDGDKTATGEVFIDDVTLARFREPRQKSNKEKEK